MAAAVAVAVTGAVPVAVAVATVRSVWKCANNNQTLSRVARLTVECCTRSQQVVARPARLIPHRVGTSGARSIGGDCRHPGRWK